jgi:hemerythrin-like domain-containing protein
MTDFQTQLDPAGPADLDQGPIDHTSMYVMHFALRRDLDDLVAAVEVTPLDDGTTWRALRWYSQLFGDLLHHHHAAEDSHYWPALAAAVQREGSLADRDTILAMQTEHARIDPALLGCRHAVDRVLERPDALMCAELHARLVELRQIVVDHMAHEERRLLPLTTRVLAPSDYAQVERAIGGTYPVRLAGRMVPWALHGMPPVARSLVLAKAGPGPRTMLRLGRRPFERRHLAAFRHVAQQHVALDDGGNLPPPPGR